MAIGFFEKAENRDTVVSRLASTLDSKCVEPINKMAAIRSGDPVLSEAKNILSALRATVHANQHPAKTVDNRSENTYEAPRNSGP